MRLSPAKPVLVQWQEVLHAIQLRLAFTDSLGSFGDSTRMGLTKLQGGDSTIALLADGENTLSNCRGKFGSKPPSTRRPAAVESGNAVLGSTADAQMVGGALPFLFAQLRVQLLLVLFPKLVIGPLKFFAG